MGEFMKRLLLSFLFCMSLVAEQRNLLLFLDKDQEEQVDNDFNVSYQFVVALMQKPGSMLVSQSLLRTVMQRRDNFVQNMRNKRSVEYQFLKIFKKVQKNVATKSIYYANKVMNRQWLDTKFPRVAGLSAEDYKQVAFNFLCFYALQNVLDEWNFIKQGHGLIFCKVSRGRAKGLTEKELTTLSNARQGPIVHALSSIVKNKKDEWVIYLSGHGYPCEGKESSALVSGMTVSEFRDFLQFLDEKMNTTLLAYNSCFAGGKDGLSVYKKNGKEVTFSFSIIMTSITDAPTYVFGTPSSFRLPPYGFNNYLDESQVVNGKLHPFFLQHFSDFFEYAHQQFCGPECMFLINHYKECVERGCPIYKIENMPMVRHAGLTKFLPLDDQFHFVMSDNDNAEVVVDDQKAILWYQEEYQGTLYCMGSVPVFISMLHEKKNQHKIHELIVSTDIASFLRQAFVSLEEQNTEIVWNIDRLTVQTRRGQKIYRNVRVVQNKHGVTWVY